MTVASPMTSNKCPLGDDCDLLIAYQHGADSMKDRITELEAERLEYLAELIYLREYGKDEASWAANHTKDAWRDMARKALGETEND